MRMTMGTPLLWRVTFTFEVGRQLVHSHYAVVAPDATTAKAKAVAYTKLDAARASVEVDPDGVMRGVTSYSRHPHSKAVA